MNFTLSEEHLLVKRMFAGFCSREIRPHGEEIDRSEELLPKVLRKCTGQGFWAALIPADYGGAGMDILSYMLMLEEIARADLSTALTVNIHNSLVVKSLMDHGTPEQQERFIEMLASGESLGAFALSEPAAGSDVAAMRLGATSVDGRYCLQGSKSWVSNGALAGLFLVFARAEKGITAFLVERETPGLQVGYREKTLGLRGLSINTVYFDECTIPPENRLGEEGQGLRIALQALSLSRLGVAALGLGGAERALEEGVRFSIEHIQFGVPIAKKQTIQNYVADAQAVTEALRCLVTQTAMLAEAGQPYSQEASIAKLFGSRVAYDVTDLMVQVHGGYGYMKDYAIERYYRDCRALELIEGTTQVQQFLIARDIYHREGLDISI
ncbi:MAG: acyl-CoA dehydrogenase [Chloroflexi bacterium]|nr:MAG: acyl-CoA dehydrogenase [Chloroflexota bacterium]